MARTAFTTDDHGFRFRNTFVNTVVDLPLLPPLTTRGLCGGMAFAALDYLAQRDERVNILAPLFEAMRAKLAGIASHSGMQGVFRLLGSDIFRVREIEPLPSATMPQPVDINLLSAARRTARRMDMCAPQRHLSPASMARISASLGRGLRSSPATAVMIQPLAQ
jgi:hypothetical protein